jgi:hypothetical protein
MPPFSILVVWYFKNCKYQTKTTLLILAMDMACNNRLQGVWCLSFCHTWKLFQSITISLIRSTAEEERVKNQNIIKITSNVLKEAWWNDKWKEEARSSRAFCSKIGVGLGSCGGWEGIFRGIVPHVPRCLRWFRPTGSYSRVWWALTVKCQNRSATVGRNFLRFLKNFTYVNFEVLAALSVRIAGFSFATWYILRRNIALYPVRQ